jgi:hypothetical protein
VGFGVGGGESTTIPDESRLPVMWMTSQFESFFESWWTSVVEPLQGFEDERSLAASSSLSSSSLFLLLLLFNLSKSRGFGEMKTE